MTMQSKQVSPARSSNLSTKEQLEQLKKRGNRILDFKEVKQ